MLVRIAWFDESSAANTPMGQAEAVERIGLKWHARQRVRLGV